MLIDFKCHRLLPMYAIDHLVQIDQIELLNKFMKLFERIY